MLHLTTGKITGDYYINQGDNSRGDQKGMKYREIGLFPHVFKRFHAQTRTLYFCDLKGALFVPVYQLLPSLNYGIKVLKYKTEYNGEISV